MSEIFVLSMNNISKYYNLSKQAVNFSLSRVVFVQFNYNVTCFQAILYLINLWVHGMYVNSFKIGPYMSYVKNIFYPWKN